ncbi:Hemolymph lipopolysaccharide-binding protein [Blattella germanica]|nr:Hemolymph lipopolysaccharide-binding protein [Blattella germanica]
MKKMFLHITAVAFLVFMTVESALHCSSPRTTDFKITVTSRRNKTGHWIAEVQMDHDSSDTVYSGPWELSVEQSTASCEQSRSVRIDATAIVPPKAGKTVEGYKLVPGVGSYKLHMNPKTWDEARQVCEEEDGHLLVLDQEYEVDIIKQMFQENPDVKPNDIAWIGVHDQFSEGKYVTITGENLGNDDFVKWDPEDQTNTTDNIAEDCIAVDRQGELLDGPCLTKIIFFCEHD